MKRILLPFLLGSASTASFAQPGVLRFWSGALTHQSIRVNVQLNAPCDSLRLVVDDDPLWDSPLLSGYVHVDSTTWCMTPIDINDLVPGTAYAYRFEVNGEVDTSAAHQGLFRTAEAGAFNYSFVVGSCNTTCTHPVWLSMADADPLFFLSTGDLHYGDPADTTPVQHRLAYEQLLLDPEPGASFFHRVPLAYVWDDHDFCGGGTNGSAPGRYAAFQAYREYVPHYPLALPQDPFPIYQSFTIGRLRFILSDMRSTKIDSVMMMDSTQRSWLKHELVAARQNGQLAVWVSSVSWNPIGYPENWGSADSERTALSDFLRDHEIRDLMIICGDAHMVAIDSGENGDFSTGQNNPYHYPIFQAAAINRAGSYKGGTYDQGGYFLNPSEHYGQFGLVNVIDDGVTICVSLEGYRTDSMSSAVNLLDSYTFCVTPDDRLDVPSVPHTDNTATCQWIDRALTLQWPGADGSGTIELIDGAGREVWSYATRWVNGQASLSRPKPRPGGYALRLRCDERMTSVPLVIN